MTYKELRAKVFNNNTHERIDARAILEDAQNGKEGD